MIDMYVIELAIALGPKEWQRLPGHNKSAPPVNRQQVFLSDPSWTAGQHALIMPDIVRLKVCPPKVLGRWNVFGTDDLQEAVRTTAPQVLTAMGIDVNATIRNLLDQGTYSVREVHITHQFHIEHFTISDFIDCLFRRLNESHRPEWMHRGEGFTINSRSRTAVYCFYNKLHELEHKGLRAYDRRMASIKPHDSWTRMGIALDREHQCIAAAAGPRLEIRLGDHFFRSKPLATGSNWLPDTADKVFQDYLGLLKLPRRVSPAWGRDRAQRRLTGTVHSTYLHWTHGENLKQVGMSAKTLARHRSAILDAMKLDIHTPASATLGNRRHVDPARVFRWDNRVVASALDVDDQ